MGKAQVYQQYTLNAKNPLARYAHRNRLARSVSLARDFLGTGRLLDYGCGTGAFISKMYGLGYSAVGYEPYMEGVAGNSCFVFTELSDIAQRGPYTVITLFEVVEHMDDKELKEFFTQVGDFLIPDGTLIFSAPIEVGPALIFKEVNRMVWQGNWEYGIFELLQAAVFGIAAKRVENIKISHKGFDFRQAIGLINACGYEVRVRGYGPLPIRTWYGNSQVFFTAARHQLRMVAGTAPAPPSH